MYVPTVHYIVTHLEDRSTPVVYIDMHHNYITTSD